jgi:hypothetical protein
VSEYELAKEQLLLMAKKLQICGDSGNSALIRRFVKECDDRTKQLSDEEIIERYQQIQRMYGGKTNV